MLISLLVYNDNKKYIYRDIEDQKNIRKFENYCVTTAHLKISVKKRLPLKCENEVFIVLWHLDIFREVQCFKKDNLHFFCCDFFSHHIYLKKAI